MPYKPDYKREVGIGIRNNQSHFKILDNLQGHKISNGDIDTIEKYMNSQIKYKINISSIRNGGEVYLQGLRIYTDGSKIEDQVGYGALLMDNEGSIVDMVNGGVSKHSTVFQAECVAMEQSLNL